MYVTKKNPLSFVEKIIEAFLTLWNIAKIQNRGRYDMFNILTPTVLICIEES